MSLHWQRLPIILVKLQLTGKSRLTLDYSSPSANAFDMMFGTDIRDFKDREVKQITETHQMSSQRTNETQ